ncbi:MAG: hypothetical protein QOG71_1809 [Pyrinomonadaceae bacterium]|nr:hypothetical protein [Pyrinomonadaceae bacterium]
MRKTFNLRIFSVSLLTSFLFLAALTVWATKSSPQRSSIEIVNQTLTVPVLAWKENPTTWSLRDLEVSFQNNNPQGILAYSIEVINQAQKQNYSIATLPFVGGRVIPPAQIVTKHYGIPHGYNLIKLTAVVFEDGTIEGDSLHANHLKGQYDGTIEQYRLALDVFRKAESNHSADALQISESLKKGFAQLPEQPKEVPDKKSSRQSQRYFMGKMAAMTQVKSILLEQLEGAAENSSGARVGMGVGDLNTRIKNLRTEKSRMEAALRPEALAEKP